ncbi:hypothetical protein B0H15DRAFT_1025316 [Mycena belliarum]|uniref:Uncharacterized protein n=1 Tax=Mycena belliarum TaxID=1033014 RepID=A0AAD6TUP5_9AGAR|nr:hypothetical protein B0H15DRAFT_1025316 [Mycena belliae]
MIRLLLGPAPQSHMISRTHSPTMATSSRPPPPPAPIYASLCHMLRRPPAQTAYMARVVTRVPCALPSSELRQGLGFALMWTWWLGRHQYELLDGAATSTSSSTALDGERPTPSRDGDRRRRAEERS